MTIIERILSTFFKHVDIEKIVDGQKVVYLRRWFLPEGGNGIPRYLHKIFRSDDDPDPHDHPWDFDTRILWNGYDDVQYAWIPESEILGIPADWAGLWETGSERMRFLRRARRKAEHIHQVKLFKEKPTWTFVTRGPYRREWNFWTQNGPVMWRKALNIPEGNPYDPGESTIP